MRPTASTARDVGIALGAVTLDIALFTQLSDAGDQTAWVPRSVPPLVIIIVGLLAAVPLSLRRRSPYAVCLILAAHAAAVTTLLGSRPLISLLVALYSAAVLLPRRRAAIALLAVLAAHAVAVGYEASFVGVGWFGAVAVATVLLLADLATWGAGRWGAGARARRTARRLRAEQVEHAQAAVDAERLRISHDLHDIVAHAVTVMLLQSGGARAVLRSADGSEHPAAEQALVALDAVDATGRQAVAELRRLLTVLRAEGADDTCGEATMITGLSELEPVLDRVRQTGVQVSVQTSGEQSSLDPSVDLTAYRVVQEALTNVNKHAGPGTRAEVLLAWQPDRLMLMITDDGPHRPLGSLGSGGFGLVGLAERVALVGGRLEHGPRIGRPGYRICAVLPTSDPTALDPGPTMINDFVEV